MKFTINTRLLLVRAIVAIVVGAGLGLAHAQPAAKVTHVTGTLVETDAAGRSRVLAADSSVSQGSRLRTAADSYAHLQFGDGSDLYLRANTEFVLDKFQYAKEQPADDSFVSRLVKGGLRQLTGLLGGRNPNAVRMSVATSTIGIRGTDFSVRMCEGKCVSDSAAQEEQVAVDSPVARVVTLRGLAIAHEALSARERTLVSGAALYKGDVVATGEGSHAALYFRDGTRMSLAENSVLGIEDYAFDAADPASGRAIFELGLGGARFWTGAISKANPDGFIFRTPTASISPRGSWLDVLVSAVEQVVEAAVDTVEKVAEAVVDTAAQVAQAVQGTAQAVGKAAQDTGQKVAKGVQALGKKVITAVQNVAGRIKQAGQAAVGGTKQAGQAVAGAARRTGQAVAGAARQVGQAVVSAEEQVASTLETAASGSAVDTSITQVSILDGAAIVTTSQGSARIDTTMPGLRVTEGGRLVAATSRVIVNAPDPSGINADPVRLFGDAGSAKDDAGVYVLVHDGAVSLAQAGVEIVLVKGEVGFADANNKPPQLIDTLPPVLRRDRLLGEPSLFSQICRP
jgi:hypothetical protein